MVVAARWRLGRLPSHGVLMRTLQEQHLLDPDEVRLLTKIVTLSERLSGVPEVLVVLRVAPEPCWPGSTPGAPQTKTPTVSPTLSASPRRMTDGPLTGHAPLCSKSMSTRGISETPARPHVSRWKCARYCTAVDPDTDASAASRRAARPPLIGVRGPLLPWNRWPRRPTTPSH